MLMMKRKKQTLDVPRPIFLLLLLILLPSPLSAATEDDVKCLRGVKNSLKDPQSKLHSWNFSNTSDVGFVCKFVGASCWNDRENKVISLQLRDFQLSGNIPESLQFCSSIQTLDLSGNALIGSIPPSVCSWFPFLVTLDLSNNLLSGQIPPDLGNCQYLSKLVLSHNSLSGFIPQLSNLNRHRLTVFSVANNHLSGQIPPSLAHFDESDFDGNGGLCGKPAGSKCNGFSTKNLAIIIAAGVFGGLTIVIGVYFACIRKKKTTESADSAMGKAFMKVSYDMLLKATGNFSSENLLGSGAFGSVFKGILDGKSIAVKVLNLQHHDASKSFMTECKTLRNVRHRNLVSIITACSSIDFQRNNFRALVYEFMSNGSLDKWLHGIHENMSLSQRVDVAIDVAQALNYLHHEGETPIVHCDLKPSNILLDDDMVAHVGDFGLARILTQPRHPNQSSTIGINGTVGYAAPEYGLGSDASTAGDVYSYGILLLELMTGKSPIDNMFKEDYNLHMYAEAALPDQVLQIADPTLEEDNVTEETEGNRAIQDALQRRVECIISVISIGVLCSNHLPQDRMKISDVVRRLQATKHRLLKAQNRRTHPARGAMSAIVN